MALIQSGEPVDPTRERGTMDKASASTGPLKDSGKPDSAKPDLLRAFSVAGIGAVSIGMGSAPTTTAV